MSTANIDIENIAAVHFIGIGGIGVSAIARMMLAAGKRVTGSDTKRSEITDKLEALGANVVVGQSAGNVPADAGLIVYTPAVKPDNPELVRGRELGIVALSYPEMLGIVSKGKKTIAVSGTHGKTTTTAMVADVLAGAGLDPTIIVGSLLKGENGDEGNFKAGKGEYFVVEACEYKRSFLNLWPQILVITNIEEDHLDYYADLADIQSAFREIAERVRPDGAIVCNPSSPSVAPVIAGLACKIIDYAKYPEPTLKVPGAHNARNAQAALGVAEALGLSVDVAQGSLAQFTGTRRRFEYRGKTANGALVYDDYAHHPTEIAATLQGARSAYPDKRIVAVFQPHLFSRTKQLLSGFQTSLSAADEVVLAPIYAAREQDDGTVTNKTVADGIPSGKAVALGSLDEVAERIGKQYGPEDAVILMGAGDIDSIIPGLIT